MGKVRKRWLEGAKVEKVVGRLGRWERGDWKMGKGWLEGGKGAGGGKRVVGRWGRGDWKVEQVGRGDGKVGKVGNGWLEGGEGGKGG